MYLFVKFLHLLAKAAALQINAAAWKLDFLQPDCITNLDPLAIS
jgi:hypothetical protein